MNIEGAMDQKHLDSLKYQQSLFKRVLNETTDRRDVLKEELKLTLDNVAFYAGIVLDIEEDIEEVRKEIKKNCKVVGENYPNEPDVFK